MLATVAKGTKGKLKASRREFEIVASKSSTTSIVKFKDEPHREYELRDDDLRANAEQVN